MQIIAEIVKANYKKEDGLSGMLHCSNSLLSQQKTIGFVIGKGQCWFLPRPFKIYIFALLIILTSFYPAIENLSTLGRHASNSQKLLISSSCRFLDKTSLFQT